MHIYSTYMYTYIQNNEGITPRYRYIWHILISKYIHKYILYILHHKDILYLLDTYILDTIISFSQRAWLKR